MKWRVLISRGLSASENMAIDDAIFQLVQEGKSTPLIRFYDWEHPTLTLGYHQSAEKEVDFAKLADKKYDFVRRPTGGRLVLHKNDVTYSIISPIIDKMSGNVMKSYETISRALAEGIRLLGVDVSFQQKELSSFSQREAANPCFNSSSKYELEVKGKKIVGSAQARKNNVLLQHGSIILEDNQKEIADLMPNLNIATRSKLSRLMEKHTVAINSCLEEDISFIEVTKSLIKGFQNTWFLDNFEEIQELESFEKDFVKELIGKKYSKNSWNLKK